LPFDSKVTLLVYDILGREVAKLVNEVKAAGFYSIVFNGINFASGVYFFRISAEGNGQKFEAVKKMVMVK